MSATKVVIETRADGAGTPVQAQTLTPGQTLTVYSITRDALDAFVANAASTWSLTSKTGSVVDGDLVAAGDNKSAVFTADDNGTAIIHAETTVGAFTDDTGIVSVIDALLTLAELKLYLGETTSANDALLTDWLIKITGVIETELGQPVVVRSVEDILNGSGDVVQYLRSGRIQSLVGSDETARLGNLQYRTSPADSWINLTDAEANISIDDENCLKIELIDGSVFPYGRKNVRVYYNCGITGRDLIDIKKLAMEKIQMMYNESKKGGNLLGKISRNVGEGGMSQNLSLKDMGPQWQDIIDRHRRLSYE